MRIFQSNIRRDGALYVWTVEGHTIDFTEEEFDAMLGTIRSGGLFSYLTAERPALLTRLLSIIDQKLRDEAFDPLEYDRESLLEQLLIDMERRVRR